MYLADMDISRRANEINFDIVIDSFIMNPPLQDMILEGSWVSNPTGRVEATHDIVALYTL